MKKLNPKAMEYIAKTYGKKFAGDEADPSASEVPSEPNMGEAETAPQPGFDSSPEANPNIAISPETYAQADIPPPETPPAQMTTEAPPQPAATPERAESDFQKKGLPDVEASFEQQKSAATESAKAQEAQGQEEAKAWQDFNDSLAKLPTINDITAKYKANDDQLFKNYQSKTLDPNRYLNNQSTGDKILSGIALVISGAGGGASGQPNLAAKMIEDNINRDIDAQKNDQTQAMNLWKLNKEEYGNDVAANLATQNQMLIGVQAKLAQAASSAKGPLAKAAADNGNALINQKLAENRFKLGLMDGPTKDSDPNSPAGMDPAKKVTWLVPPAQQEAVFGEIAAAQSATQNAPEILEAFDRAAKEARPLTGGFTGTAPGAFNPWSDTPGQQKFITLITPTFSNIDKTVREFAMKSFFDNNKPQFGDNDAKINSKRQAVIDYLQTKDQAPRASGFGINLKDYPSTNVRGAIPPQISPVQEQKINAFMKSNPSVKTSAQAIQILKQHGKF